MGREIERKFLVRTDDWRHHVSGLRHIRQAYLTSKDKISLRVRIDRGGPATLTIKTATAAADRSEFEYEIPVHDAEELIHLRLGELVVKVRHHVPMGGLLWEVDVFEGNNAGLVLAEIELDDANQVFERPPWVGPEVTHDRRYYNAELALTPFPSWTDRP